MLPYFYEKQIAAPSGDHIRLSEETSKHGVQVLRMQAGDRLMLTDGMGTGITATLVTADRRHSVARVDEVVNEAAIAPFFTLAIAFTKNKARNEWLLEKATEIGIKEIIPLLAQRSEKEKLNYDRLNGILVSAMLQSQQRFLPRLHESMTLKQFLKYAETQHSQKRIAHCIEEEKHSYAASLQKGADALVMIGPEGDFSEEEVALCLQNQFKAVSLGSNRLRTETAGLYACTVFNSINHG